MSSSEVRSPRWVDLNKQRPPERECGFAPLRDLHASRPAVRDPVPSAEEAHARGLAEGEARGREAARRELEPALARLAELSAALADARRERIAGAEQDLLDLAADIARRILHGELRQESDCVVRMAKACIESAQESEGELVLHIAPGDAQLVRAHLPELELDLQGRSLRIESDAQIAAGGVVLVSAGRCYEGRPERILEAAVLAAVEEPA